MFSSLKPVHDMQSILNGLIGQPTGEFEPV